MDTPEKLAIFICSPRRYGNSYQIADILVNKMKLSEKYDVTLVKTFNYDIKHCTGCEYCRKHFDCHIKDEMNSIYNILKMTDKYIVISPLYFANVPGHFKTIIDRLNPIWHLRNQKKDCSMFNSPERVGNYIIIGAGDVQNEYTGCETTIKYMFNTCGIKPNAKLFLKNIDTIDDLNKIENLENKLHDIIKF